MTFLDPYQVSAVLSGVIKGLEPVRPNFLQSFFGNVQYTDKTRVNLDVEFNVKNVMGTFTAPKADVTPVKLPDFGTGELYFAYSKEGIDSDDFDTLNTRQIGQQFGQVDVMANDAARFLRKVALVEARFENLFELVSSQILLYGAYQAAGEKHPTINYNFNRTVITAASDLANAPLVPSVNLTTSAVYAPWDNTTPVLPVVPTGSGITSGAKSWTNTNIDAGTATPIKDVVRMYETANARAGNAAVIMSDDAYAAFSYDQKKNFSETASLITQVILGQKLDTAPRAQSYKGLTFRRTYQVDEAGNFVNIYTYKAVYSDRISGVENSYIGNGWVIFIPPATNGLKVYGRIMNRKAGFATMPRWMNYWTDEKTGETEWEYHTNFLMAHTDIDSIVAWKVL